MKTVPESDLIALKKSHETELAESKASVEQLTKDVASERAAKDAAETLAKEVPTLRESLTTLTSERDVAKAGETAAVAKQEEMTTSSLNTRKNFLKTTHNIDESKLTDLDESQLSALESVLPGVSKPAAPNGANLDLTPSGGSGDSSKLSSREKIAAGLNSQTP